MFLFLTAGWSVFAVPGAGELAEAVQGEIDKLTAGEITGISDELLDSVYLNWKVLETEMKRMPFDEGLQYMLPIYTNLNVFLQNEPGLTNEVPSMRIVKMTSIIANLFSEILNSSRELLSTFDPESYEFRNREAGLSQAQIGGGNMVLGGSITLFTVELPDDIYTELKKNLWNYGPLIYHGIDADFKTQIMVFYNSTVEPAVLAEQKGSYDEFISLLNQEK